MAANKPQAKQEKKLDAFSHFIRIGMNTRVAIYQDGFTSVSYTADLRVGKTTLFTGCGDTPTTALADLVKGFNNAMEGKGEY